MQKHIGQRSLKPLIHAPPRLVAEIVTKELFLHGSSGRYAEFYEHELPSGSIAYH